MNAQNEDELKWQKTDKPLLNNFVQQIEQLSQQIVQMKLKAIVSRINTLGQMHGIKDKPEFKNLQEKIRNIKL